VTTLEDVPYEVAVASAVRTGGRTVGVAGDGALRGRVRSLR
jgi:hypothetical protein